MRIIKTWCENTKEGEEYLKYNDYGSSIKRIFNSSLYLCLGRTMPKVCKDVKIIINI